MITCQSCQKKLPDDAKFCIDCGRPTLASSGNSATPSETISIKCRQCQKINEIPRKATQLTSSRDTSSLQAWSGRPEHLNRGIGPAQNRMMPTGREASQHVRRFLTCQFCGADLRATVPAS